MLVRSIGTTRGSRRRRSSNWPRPTSTAHTSAAPRESRTSVNPPVEAPASRQRRPSTAMSHRVSAASSLNPPRLAQVASAPATTKASPAATNRAGLSAGAPPTVTRPAAIASWARSRLGASPRRTNSRSRRRRPGRAGGTEASGGDRRARSGSGRGR